MVGVNIEILVGGIGLGVKWRGGYELRSSGEIVAIDYDQWEDKILGFSA